MASCVRLFEPRVELAGDVVPERRAAGDERLNLVSRELVAGVDERGQRLGQMPDELEPEGLVRQEPADEQFDIALRHSDDPPFLPQLWAKLPPARITGGTIAITACRRWSYLPERLPGGIRTATTQS